MSIPLQPTLTVRRAAIRDQLTKLDEQLASLSKHLPTKDLAIKKAIDELLDQRLVLMGQRDLIKPIRKPIRSSPL